MRATTTRRTRAALAGVAASAVLVVVAALGQGPPGEEPAFDPAAAAGQAAGQAAGDAAPDDDARPGSATGPGHASTAEGSAGGAVGATSDGAAGAPVAGEPAAAEGVGGGQTAAAAEAAPLPPGVARPEWLHTRPLPLGADGEALPGPTPPELVDRRIPTTDLLPPPPDGVYRSQVVPVPDDVLARSTWTPECPVTAEELRYVTVSFWGFDERLHTGEMLVHADWAEEVAAIFGRLHAQRYPIEEMRIVTAEELQGVPTGDTNNTTAFVCRPVRGGSTWSQHAYGLAVDINPFINPYQRGDRILPELAEAYLDRSHERPGMLHDDHVAVTAFDEIGWGWGGRWRSLVDWMHFSANGR